MSESSSHYSPESTESRWYEHWMEQGYFRSKPDERTPFSIVIPPPNVTGVLHMGHMLDNTIQDVLIRKARKEGLNACWVPGTDHASIATEAKVVRWLREEKGISKRDISRQEFLKYAWEWTDKYGGIILTQLKRLGASCDWDRTAFTMDEDRSEQVIQVFIDLYSKGHLYRDYRMVNWDSKAQTVLSNEEVLFSDEQTNLNFVRYPIEGSEGEFITIATTRPETILGDTAIAVHPEDERYAHLRGKNAIVPMVDRVIPILFDDYVDREFGTGALKITPAHDINDYEIGKKHSLEVIDVLTDDGHMSEAAQFFIGDDMIDARKKVVAWLKEHDQIDKIEPYRHSVGRSERTNVIVEPRLSLQWYVRMANLAKPALEAVMNDEVEFFPKNQKNTYRHWMENIRDWCISRQLWWGHQIPAYYVGEEVFVAKTAEEALAAAQEKLGRPELTRADLKQDEDVLDTWFSSWLWPFSVFNGLNTNEEVEYYYPTSVLATGWDIIFLWVARMIIAGYEFKGERPFEKVYFHGMVRDQQRRKMSKSLGNSPDALELLDTFGADGVRFGMMSCSPAGADLLFDEKLCAQGRNFCNKMWNSLRLIEGWEVADTAPLDHELLAIEWMKAKITATWQELQHDFTTFRLSEALIKLYILIWSDYCSWYLETIKPGRDQQISAQTVQDTKDIMKSMMNILHPFMPFITEEIWQRVRGPEDGDCIVSPFPESGTLDQSSLDRFEYLKNIISKIRDLRNQNGVKAREQVTLLTTPSQQEEGYFNHPGFSSVLQKLGFVENLNIVTEAPEDKQALAFVVSTSKFYLMLEQEINVEDELAKYREELIYQEGFVKSATKKLSNERFVQNAPAAVVAKEQQKLDDGEKRIVIIKETIARLTVNS